MRVALLQVDLNSKSRAANLQRVVAAVQCAAQATPPPDLLVLPGGCDTGGGVANRRLSDSYRQSVKETIAWLARDWGVFIAAGFHRSNGHALEPWVGLFDPDGDPASRDPVEDAAGGVSAVGVWRTAVGSLGVVEPSAPGSPADRLAEVEPGSFLAMPCAPGAWSNERCTRAGEFVRRIGMGAGSRVFWGVVVPAGQGRTSPGGEHGYGTYIRDASGAVIASAKNGEETVVCAMVSPESALPEAWKASVAYGRHAD
ncbi:MAG: hypothetical protein ACE5HE_11940 [Phycisphaerae bacterium]